MYHFRYLSTGHLFTTIASSFRLGISTVGKIVRETCDQIWLQFMDCRYQVYQLVRRHSGFCRSLVRWL